MQPISRNPLKRHALGLGLRPSLFPEILASPPPVDYFEIISENFLGPSLPPQLNLAMVAANYPVVMHGVSLNLLGHEPLRGDYLDQLKMLADRLDTPFVSDHLCWTGAHGIQHHDLLPTPYTYDLIEFAAERANTVQRHVGRPFALENLSSYVSFKSSQMPEFEFYRRVVEAADVSFMLDINNIYVSSTHQGFNPTTYLENIPLDRVVQVHLAGHERQPDGTLLDSHNQPVCDAVWELYRRAWILGGPFPTLLEWDEGLPSLEGLCRELEKAREYQK